MSVTVTIWNIESIKTYAEIVKDIFLDIQFDKKQNIMKQ